LDAQGYFVHHQKQIRRLSLITDGTCPHAGQHLEGLSCFTALTELEWEGIQHPSEVSTSGDAAPVIDLTDEQTPDGPNMMKATLISGNQAPNLESHHTHMAGQARVLKEIVTSPQYMYNDPLDTEPNTPIPTSYAAPGEYVPPDRVARQALAPASAVVGETEEEALLLGVQVQDIPTASNTRKRKCWNLSSACSFIIEYVR
jgi:hypothetical protein